MRKLYTHKQGSARKLLAQILGTDPTSDEMIAMDQGQLYQELRDRNYVWSAPNQIWQLRQRKTAIRHEPLLSKTDFLLIRAVGDSAVLQKQLETILLAFDVAGYIITSVSDLSSIGTGSFVQVNIKLKVGG